MKRFGIIILKNILVATEKQEGSHLVGTINVQLGVGYALEKSGVSFASFPGRRCPKAHRNSGMVASAQQLANWLRKGRFPGCPSPEKHTGKDAFDKIDGRTGIIFLANYWQRSTDEDDQRTGDHIDLWNGWRMTSLTSIARIHLGISWDGLWSDYRLASRVLFWHNP